MYECDRFVGFSQAVMVVADSKQSLTITGNGDVLEPHDGVIGAAACPLKCNLVSQQHPSKATTVPCTAAVLSSSTPDLCCACYFSHRLRRRLCSGGGACAHWHP